MGHSSHISPRLLAELEESVKRGQGQAVRQQLTSLNSWEIERGLAVGIAKLCRRVDLISLGLCILNPIVRAGTWAQATDAEKAEYAVLLHRTGATDEAISLLKGIRPERCPASLLYLAFCHVGRWDYGAALPELRRYVASGALDDYQLAVGRLNLAAALVQEGQYSEAEQLLETIASQSRERGYKLLHGNCLETRAQLLILSGDFASARRYIGLAEEHLKETRSLDELFVRKWKAVCVFYETGDDDALRAIRAEAIALHHWETVRDCDFFAALAREDGELCLRLYFGTPFEAYRRKLRKAFPSLSRLPESYDFAPLSQGQGEPRTLDVRLPPKLPTGQLLHQVLILLARDRYRPLRLGTIFSILYPEEHFHPQSSPNRVHQLIRRIRRWARSLDSPLEIVEVDGAFRLEPGPGLALRVPREPLSLHSQELLLCRLKAALTAAQSMHFSATQARAALKCSATSIQRLLSWAVAAGRLRRTGSGPATFYQLAS